MELLVKIKYLWSYGVGERRWFEVGVKMGEGGKTRAGGIKENKRKR